MVRSHQVSGFTLIELMVVLFIAGLLAFLSVTAISSYMKRASGLNVLTDVQSIVRMVPLQSKRQLCAASLRIDLHGQNLEAWICGVKRRQYDVPEDYSIKVVGHSLKQLMRASDILYVSYTPSAGGFAASLELYKDSALVRSIDLSAVPGFHAAP